MKVKLQVRLLLEAVHVGSVDYDDGHRALEVFLRRRSYRAWCLPRQQGYGKAGVGIDCHNIASVGIEIECARRCAAPQWILGSPRLPA